MNNIHIDLDNAIDENFFGSLKENKSLKLQELFAEDGLSYDDKQQSLKYQRSKDAPTSCNSTSITLMAKVVTAYKQGELQGKVGLALIENPDNTFNILIYKTKTHILVALKLQPEKNLLYKQVNYWQFYDEVPTYWSFSFGTPIDENEFVEMLHSKKISFKANEEAKQITENLSDLSNLKNEEHSSDDVNYETKIDVDAAKETKSSLIQRMAKMGKPLPSLSYSKQQTTTEFSDSSDTEDIKAPSPLYQTPITPRSSKLKYNKPYQQLVPSIVELNSAANGVYPVNALEFPYMQMLLTEQRTQGSELRMNINKLENKIEKVLDKLEHYEGKEGKQQIQQDDEILELEEKILMLKKENKKLKQNLLENSSYEFRNTKMKDVLDDFKKDLEHLDIDYKQDLKNILTQLCDKLKKSRANILEMKQKVSENDLEIKKVKTELELNIEKNVELRNEITALNQEGYELKNKINEKEIEIVKQNQDILGLQRKLQEKDKEAWKTNDALIKNIMNHLYVDIADKLNYANLTQTDQILSLVASSIKQQTLKTLQQNKPKDNLN